MKGQFFVTQLALLFEQRAAQHAFRRQPPPPGLAHPLPPQIARHQVDQPGLPIQPMRHGLQLAADVVLGKYLEYSGLDGALLTHCRLRREGRSRNALACTRYLPETAEPGFHKIAN